MKQSEIQRKSKFSALVMRKTAVELQLARFSSDELQHRITQQLNKLESLQSKISALDKKLDELIAGGGWQLHEMLQAQLREVLSQYTITEIRLKHLKEEHQSVRQQSVKLKLHSNRLAERLQQFNYQYQRLQERRVHRLNLATVT